jgi:hypothetical protein
MGALSGSGARACLLPLNVAFTLQKTNVSEA